MKYQCIIWDIDGTLLNTQEGLVSAYMYTIKKLALPTKTAQEITHFIGPVPQNVFKDKFGMSAEKAQNAADIFRERYKNNDLLKACLYDGIVDVLQVLKKEGIKQAVATNKRQDYASDICHYFQLDEYCFPILGPDNISSKSKADLIRECMKSLNVNTAVMVGDTNSDKEAANQAGIDFIGVNYGFGFSNISNYADTPLEILEKLKGL